MRSQKLETGQAAIKSDIEAVLKEQSELEASLISLGFRVKAIEAELSSFSKVKDEIGSLINTTATLTQSSVAMLNGIDDLENHSRRSNLIFYWLADPHDETWENSEQRVIDLCCEKPGITVRRSEV